MTCVSKLLLAVADREMEEGAEAILSASGLHKRKLALGHACTRAEVLLHVCPASRHIVHRRSCFARSEMSKAPLEANFTREKRQQRS